MGWTDPDDFVINEVVTAEKLNEQVKDNLVDLDRRTTATRGNVATSESTTSGSFTNLSTTGPSATCTVGSTGMVLIAVSCSVTSASNIGGLMGYAISGASTIAAADAQSVGMKIDSSTMAARLAAVFVHIGLTPGSTTFTAKYKSLNSGSTVTFADRYITAIPLGA